MAVTYTNVGRALVTGLVSGAESVPANWYVGWGTGGATAPDPTDTTLNTEVKQDMTSGADREICVADRVQTTVANDTNRFVGTMTATASGTISEAGLFTAATVGTMPIRGNFTGIALGSGDYIEFTFKLQQSVA